MVPGSIVFSAASDDDCSSKVEQLPSVRMTRTTVFAVCDMLAMILMSSFPVDCKSQQFRKLELKMGLVRSVVKNVD